MNSHDRMPRSRILRGLYQDAAFAAVTRDTGRTPLATPSAPAPWPHGRIADRLGQPGQARTGPQDGAACTMPVHSVGPSRRG